MNSSLDYHRCTLLALGFALFAGCTTTSTTLQEPGAAHYAVTDVTRVQLLPWAPSRPQERMGEIIIQPAQGTSWQEIDLELRQAAADLGAHAMYVVWDPSKRFSSVQVDPLASDERSNYPTNGIVAVAIRLK